jgi:hypothetical protein
MAVRSSNPSIQTTPVDPCVHGTTGGWTALSGDAVPPVNNSGTDTESWGSFTMAVDTTTGFPVETFVVSGAGTVRVDH